MCFCHVGDGVFGCFFHDVAFLVHFVSPVEDGADDKGNGEHSGKELEGSAVAAGGFFHECQDERACHACDAPCSQDGSVDGSELAYAEDVRKECRHAGEAAAVAGDDGKNECLEDEAFSGNGELMESKDFKEEEYHVGDAAADPVGNAGTESVLLISIRRIGLLFLLLIVANMAVSLTPQGKESTL